MTSTRHLRALTGAIAFSLTAVHALAQGTAPSPFPQVQPGGGGIQDPLAAVPGQPPTSGTAAPAASGAGRATPGATRSLNLEQKAWDNPSQNKGAHQTKPGFLPVAWHANDVPTINMREGMLTVFEFPEDEDIVKTLVSDNGTFETDISPNRRSVAIRAMYAGVDGNIVMYGKSNNAYNFYLRAMPYNATTIPDTTVRVIVPGMKAEATDAGDATGSVAAGAGDGTGGYGGLFTPTAAKDEKAFKAGSREFARSTPLVTSNMRNNIDIKVRDPKDQAIAPLRAWHDDHFTYLDFGPRASSMNVWPVASLIIQGTESPVGARVAGRDKSMMIVEGVGNIALRDGQLIVCLDLIEPNDDNRFSIPPGNRNPLPAEVIGKAEVVHVAAGPLVAKGAPQAPRPVPREKAAPAAEVATVTFPDLTAEAGQALWSELKRAVRMTSAVTPAWIGGGGAVLEHSPPSGATAAIRVAGLDAAAARKICGDPRWKRAHATCSIAN